MEAQARRDLDVSGNAFLNLIYVGDQLINCDRAIRKVLVQTFITNDDILDDIWILIRQFDGLGHLLFSR